jgi:hypothetical protein
MSVDTGGGYEPYHLDHDPEEYADFESAEDRGDVADLAEAREPCGRCGGHLKPRGAFGAQVVFDCLGCGERSTIVMEGWGPREGEDGEWDDDEEEDD